MANWNAMLDEVMRERGSRLVAYASLLVGPAAAEDLVQDALIRSFTRERTFPHVNAAEAYVRRAMATMSIDAYRYRRTRLTGEQRSARTNAVRDEAVTVDIDTPLDVAAALAVLSPRVRACVLLRFYDDLTVREVGEQLGLATGTVKRYLHDAAATLEAHLGPDVLGGSADGATADRSSVSIVVTSDTIGTTKGSPA
jgi:RNA polymerase sigma factor (sigma-70 family)